MPRIAYFDCLSGISGDMTLGALIDLGVEASAIQAAVRSMGLAELSITSTEVKKAGFRAVYVNIDHPPEHAHRHLHHITEMIDRADQIDSSAKALAKRIFHQVAIAEAKVHGSTIEKVHFHEVGAIDSIADIVGTAVAMTQLGIESTISSPIPTGTGTVTIAHGKVSIPAPATAEILRGVPIAPCDIAAELTTPTGAAIIKATATGFGSLPAMTIDAVGYGAGTMDLDGQANVLRVLLGEIADDQITAATKVESDRVVQLADCAQRLIDAGALDVFQTAATMKKGRSGVVLSVIASADRVGLMEQLIFQHSTSIGIRRQTMDRHKLSRRSETLTTEFGDVKTKVVTLPDGQERMSVEDDDARRLATESSTTADAVRKAAMLAWG
ncbi:UNVERIFIED_CONTAM: hypothetical protein GTU68_003596 [Idotea baltica]|nr:hypothetical protein [Idotea baltica]